MKAAVLDVVEASILAGKLPCALISMKPRTALPGDAPLDPGTAAFDVSLFGIGLRDAEARQLIFAMADSLAAGRESR
jgi:hypothetical protein